MNNHAVLITLRLLHILGGVFWVGTITLMAFFLFPAQRGAGPAGADFMRRVFFERKLAMYLAIALTLTLLSGFFLYGRLAAEGDGAWARSNTGIAFGIGGAAALVGAIVGMVFGSRAGRRAAAIGQSMQAAGGPPDPAKVAQMEALGRQAALTARIGAALVLFATAIMAVARYV